MSSPSLFAVGVSVLAGAGIVLQAGANGQLGKALGHPLYATGVSLALSLLLLLPLLVWLKPPLPDMRGPAQSPAWIWMGGAFGLFYVSSAVIFAPRLGAASFMIAVFGGQLLCALLLDSFGAFGFEQKPLLISRVAGVGLVLAGMVVMNLPTQAGSVGKAHTEAVSLSPGAQGPRSTTL